MMSGGSEGLAARIMDTHPAWFEGGPSYSSKARLQALQQNVLANNGVFQLLSPHCLLYILHVHATRTSRPKGRVTH